MAVQLRSLFVSKDVDPDHDPENDVTLLARRIRPAMTGTLFTPALRYRLHLSTAPGSLEFMDLYFDYHLCRHAQFRVGQWKIPFSRYRAGAFRNLTVVEWSILPSFFGAERQIGVMVQNMRDPANRFVYAFGVFNGVNARAAHGLGIAKTYGEKTTNPSDMKELAPADTVHPELVLHLAYRHKRIDVRTDTDWMGTGFRFSPALSVAWDLRPDDYQDFALRLSAEMLMKARGWSFFAAAFVGFAPWGDAHLNQKFAAWGGLAQTSYLIRRRFEISARYAVFQVGADFRNAARRRADGIIAAELDPQAQQLLAEQYVDAGQVKLEQEATVGFNWYLIGASLKWQTDISWLGHSYVGDTGHDIRVRTQLQLAF